MKYTPLYGEYGEGAKVVDFYGWALPVQFSGTLHEHQHTRTKAGLFDCSHMGEFLFSGMDAIRAFDRLVCGDMPNLAVGRCRYTGILNAQGGIVDDCVALRLSEDELYVATNAGPREHVSEILCAVHPLARDLSAETVKIDLQGPLSRDILLELGLEDIECLKYWTGTRTTWEGTEIIAARAGYTGELGYELYVPNALGPEVWRTFAAQPDVLPCGLGARDTLRSEMGYTLYGKDVVESTTPLEAGMDRFIAWDTEFLGKERLLEQRARGGYPILTAVKSPTRRAPREGFEVKHAGEVVGVVTSGTFGPSVGAGVGLAYLPEALAVPGTRFTAGPKDMELVASVIPVYQGGTCRMKLPCGELAGAASAG